MSSMGDPQAQGSYDADAATGGATTAPGWYPDPTGLMRWWDGTQWGPYQEGGAGAMAPVNVAQPGLPDARSQAALANWLGLLGFVGPLIIYVTSGDKDPFVKHHAAEALNFQITMGIGILVSGILMCVLIGFVTIFVFWGMSIVFAIIAAQAANRGEWYRYPMSIRMVSGAQGG